MGSWERRKDELGKEVTQIAYRDGIIETIFNTTDPSKREKGWILKNGTNSIYFINLRKAGNSPEFTAKAGKALGYMIKEEAKDLEVLIGVDMAGIPIVSAISSGAYVHSKGKISIPWGYTRPLPPKENGEDVRTVEEAVSVLELFKQGKVSGKKWGSHRLVEAEFHNNMVVGIGDDMITDAGSKLIAGTVINYEIASRGLSDVKTKYVVVVMDREQGGREALVQKELELLALIPMKTKGFKWLEGAMPGEQYEHILRFANQSELYQDIGRDPKVDKNKGQSSEYMQKALDLAKV